MGGPVVVPRDKTRVNKPKPVTAVLRRNAGAFLIGSTQNFGNIFSFLLKGMRSSTFRVFFRIYVFY